MEKRLVYSLTIGNIGITAIWYILLPFGNLGRLWYIFARFGKLGKVKSGNPGGKQKSTQVSKMDSLRVLSCVS
jgi:hypothetical protein